MHLFGVNGILLHTLGGGGGGGGGLMHIHLRVLDSFTVVVLVWLSRWSECGQGLIERGARN